MPAALHGVGRARRLSPRRALGLELLRGGHGHGLRCVRVASNHAPIEHNIRGVVGVLVIGGEAEAGTLAVAWWGKGSGDVSDLNRANDARAPNLEGSTGTSRRVRTYPFIEPLIAGSATVWDSLRFLCAAVAIPPLPMPIKGVVFRQDALTVRAQFCRAAQTDLLPPPETLRKGGGRTREHLNRAARGAWLPLSHAEPPP